MSNGKIYAVKVGRNPGLFRSWGECKKQVHGFKGARFKSFSSEAEAKEWLGDSEGILNLPKIPMADVSNPPSRKTDADYIVFTDGSCLVNPLGPGGYAAIVVHVLDNDVVELTGGSPSTTNNRMEMCAAIAALDYIPEGASVDMYVDSQYVQNGFESGWVQNWKRRGWKTSTGGEVKNQDLWKRLDVLYSKRKVSIHWVKGHNGNLMNERCDELARGVAISFS